MCTYSLSTTMLSIISSMNIMIFALLSYQEDRNKNVVCIFVSQHHLGNQMSSGITAIPNENHNSSCITTAGNETVIWCVSGLGKHVLCECMGFSIVIK